MPAKSRNGAKKTLIWPPANPLCATSLTEEAFLQSEVASFRYAYIRKASILRPKHVFLHFEQTVCAWFGSGAQDKEWSRVPTKEGAEIGQAPSCLPSQWTLENGSREDPTKMKINSDHAESPSIELGKFTASVTHFHSLVSTQAPPAIPRSQHQESASTTNQTARARHAETLFTLS